MTLRDRLLRVLRVPPEPTPPPGDQRVRVFRAAPNYFRYRLTTWLLRELGGLAAILAYFWLPDSFFPDWFVPLRFQPPAVDVGPVTFTEDAALTIFAVVEAIGVAVFVVQATVSGLLLRLDFEQRWYIVSERSLRIREGLIRLHEKTMTFANVQHVSIRQNPIQRWLGIADVEVRTAGGGSKSGQEHEHGDSHNLHIAYFRGVSDPREISDLVRERLKAATDAGLGDPDDRSAPEPVVGGLLDAAQRVRDEARALKEALSPPVSP